MYKTSKYDTELELLKLEQLSRVNAYHQAQEIISHYETVTVGIKIPLLQSVITSLLLSILVTLACYSLDWGKWYQVLPISFITILALDWIRRSEAWRRSIYNLEMLLHTDISRDGIIGEPVEEPVRETVELIISRDDGSKRSWIEFPVSRAKLAEMASEVASGSAFTEASMSGAGALFSRAEFNQVRDIMLKRELIRWKNEASRNLGVEFTDTGWRVIRALAGEHRGVHPSTIKLPHLSGE